jgi:hypothetical protein
MENYKMILLTNLVSGRARCWGTDDAKRRLRNERKRRLAARKDAGLACTGPVEYDDVMLQFLLKHVSMDDGSDYGDDPVKIGEAVSAWWREAAYGTKK